jgi:hypothetical protein
MVHDSASASAKPEAHQLDEERPQRKDITMKQASVNRRGRRLNTAAAGFRAVSRT